MRLHLSIQRRFQVLGAVFAVGLAGLAFMALSTVSLVKVGGPEYQVISDGKDLVADILPPPVYLLESRQAMWELIDAARHDNRGAIQTLTEKQDRLAKEFDTRVAHWGETLPAGPMKATLLEKAQAPGRRFLTTMQEKFIPAVKSGDLDRATELAHGELAEAYQEHRDAIDEVVTLATAANAANEARVASIIRTRTIALQGLALALLAIVAAISWATARSVLRPIRATISVLKDLATGDGDLRTRLDESQRDEVGEMSRSFNAFISKLHDIIAGVKTSAQQVSQASRELTAASDTISSSAQEQASSLEETAASLEEITATIKQNADNAGLANQLAANARDVAEKGGRVVANAVTAMSEINDSSRKIADIITTIDEIAFQTNLLALNAAVEAARAGEQGRGFAVVASEVRSLAQRSASAAREIKGLIGDSVKKVEDGSQLVNRSGATLEEIVTAVKRVTDVVAEIAAASREQSVGVEEVNKAVTQMDQVTQSNAAQPEEQSATAGHLSDQAREVLDVVGRFQLANDSPAPTPIAKHPQFVAAQPKAARAPQSAAPAALARTGTDDGFEEF